MPIPPVAWSTPKKHPRSEVQVLLTEDLQEDESGEDEEYIPHYGKRNEKEEVNHCAFYTKNYVFEYLIY